MKRIFALLLLCLFCSVIICGCDKKEDNNISYKDALLEVMKNKREFTAENGKKTLFEDYIIPDTLDDIEITAEKYVFVDLDGDGADELAVLCTTDYGLYMILRYDNDSQSVYGYSIGVRSFINLKENGTFMQSNGAGINSIAEMSFEKATLKIKELAVKDDAENIYKIAGKAVAEQEAKNYFDAWEEEPDIEWQAVDDTKAVDEKNEYTAFLKDIYANDLSAQEQEFCFKDIDGNGVDELLIKTAGTQLSVYVLDGQVKQIGNREFSTGTLRLLHSDDASYPGIISFTVGGGVNHYGYITLKDNEQLAFEQVFEENYSDDSDSITEISADKQLIAACQNAYEENKDIEFFPLSSVIGEK